MVAKLDHGDQPSEGLYASVSGVGASESARDVVLLHGLFGMGNNLGILARALAPDYRVHQLDLLNHGRSPWRDIAGLSELADTVKEYLANTIEGPAVVLGHSLGGKVAMQLALRHPHAVHALVAADIAPVTYAGSHDAVFRAIAAVEAARPASRGDAATLMREHLQEEGVVQFLLLSLARSDDRSYRWRFNAAGLRSNYESLLAAPTAGTFAGPALFIGGANSDYIDERGAAAARLMFPEAELVMIADTGHWLHAEKPVEFNALVQRFLSSLNAGARGWS